MTLNRTIRPKTCLQLFLVMILVLAGSLVRGQNLKVIDSIRNAIRTAPQERQFDLLNAIGFEYRFSFPDSTIYYCSKAYALGQRIRVSSGLSRPLSFIGLAKANQGDYSASLEYHNKSLTVAAEQQDTLQLAHGHNNIGRIFFDKGDLVRAYNQFVISRDLFEKINDTSGLAYVYRSLANVFKAKEDYANALENSEKALVLRKALGDPRAISSAYMELGLVYQDMDTTPLALKQFEIADSIASEMNDRTTKAEITIGIAEILFAEGDVERPRWMAEDVLTIVSERSNQKVFLRARLLLCRIKIAAGQYAKALPILTSVYSGSEITGNLVFQRDAALLLALVHTKLGNAMVAKDYQYTHRILQSKIYNEDLNKEIERLQFQLQTEKTEKENESLKAQQVRDEAIIAQQQFENVTLLIIAFFVGVIALVAWSVSRKRKAINRKLEDQNLHILNQREEIFKQNEILSHSNKELDLLNNEKDTLMNIVAHDLKSPLNRISGLTHILDREGNFSSQQRELLHLIKECTRGGIDLISGLLDVHALNEVREYPKPTAILFDEFLRQKVQAFFPIAEAKGEQIRVNNLIEKRVISDASYLGRIIDNLLSNAIKFSPRNSMVEISAGWKGGCIHLSVKDSGPGFTPQDLKQLYQKFRKLSAQPTAGESSHGLGLAIVKTLVDRLGGTIELSTSSEGSEFLVRIPAEIL